MADGSLFICRPADGSCSATVLRYSAIMVSWRCHSSWGDLVKGGEFLMGDLEGPGGVKAGPHGTKEARDVMVR